MKGSSLLFTSLFLYGALSTLFCGDMEWTAIWEHACLRLRGLDAQWNPLLDERIPRLIVLICTGGALAASGTILQSLFQNPLASPSILGVTCGGHLMVTLAFILHWHLAYPFSIPIAAFSGCILTLLLVYALAKNKGWVSLHMLILTGIAISTLLLAVREAITYVLRDEWFLIRTLREWEAGSTADRAWNHVHLQLPPTLIGFFGAMYYRTELNLLSMGEAEALNMGVDVKKVRWRLFLFVSLLTGGAIAAVGSIGFFGLILPHMIRRLEGANTRALIPFSIFGGGAALVAMDAALRASPLAGFTIGNISTILGGIFFLTLLVQNKYTYPRRLPC